MTTREPGQQLYEAWRATDDAPNFYPTWDQASEKGKARWAAVEARLAEVGLSEEDQTLLKHARELPALMVQLRGLAVRIYGAQRAAPSVVADAQQIMTICDDMLDRMEMEVES